MWKPLRESSEAKAAGQSGQRATHKNTRLTNLLPLNKNKHSQVVYVANPLSSDITNQPAGQGKEGEEGGRRSSDEGFADDLLTESDSTWLWLAAEPQAGCWRRWRRQVGGAVAVAAALMLTAIVTVICFRLVSPIPQISAASYHETNNISLSNGKGANVSFSSPSTSPLLPGAPAKSVTGALFPVSLSSTKISGTASTSRLTTTRPATAVPTPPKPTIVQCAANQFFCPEGMIRHRYLPSEGGCIWRSQVCDGNIDCVRGVDENNCTCRAHEFRCRVGVDRWRGNGCVPRTAMCDRVADCLDDSDEQNCTFTCPAGQFICASGRVRVPRRLADRSLLPYCLRWTQQCDGSADCEDGSDEFTCNHTCPTGMKRCENGTTQVETLLPTPCLRLSYWCDRLPHCSDGSDERNCTYKCPWGLFACVLGDPVYSGRATGPSVTGCLYNKQRCDGIRNCRDGSDEEGC